MNHIIGKQIIDLQINTDQEAHVLQHQFSRLYWNEMVPAMNQLFDELSGPDEMLTIDRLEINLGNMSTKELQKDLFIPLLKKELEKWFQNNKRLNKNLKIKPIRKSVFEKWIFFLTNGYLPWSLQQFPENWTKIVFETLAANAIAFQAFKSIITQRPHVRKRLIEQHDAYFLQHVLETITTIKQSQLTSYALSLITQEEKDLFWEFSFEKTLNEENKLDSETLIRLFKEKEKSNTKLNASIVPPENFETVDSTELNDEAIYIQNAGIILLHPFLQRFFDKLDLLDGHTFKDHEAACRAIHLLHYMATDIIEPAEYDLSFMKFLCGIPLNLPVKKYLTLSDKEMEEADALMQAAIQHWGALGDVSNASLQETFLQRAGKLSHTRSGWTLQIERKTVDILLNQLPWNIGIIKLPWMDDILKTDWI